VLQSLALSLSTEHKLHCSALGAKALKNGIDNHYATQKTGKLAYLKPNRRRKAGDG
jgi:NifU-like protein involved in Fe-S cluster formation